MFKIHSKTEPQTPASSESNQRIYDFLDQNKVGVLATVGPNGSPHATVVYYSISKDFTVTFTTKRDTKKHDDIQHDSRVELLVFEAASQTTAQLVGHAEDMTDNVPEAQVAFKNTLRAAMKTSLAGMPPVSKLQAGHYVVYKIQPKQIRMAVYSRPDPTTYDMFETIDF